VVAATDEYRDDSDVLGRFLEECCEVDPQATVALSELFDAYAEWCSRNKLKAMTSISFGKKLGPRGFEKARVGKHKVHTWVGVGLREFGEGGPRQNVIYLNRQDGS
jgi:putative DNA primase/helicase